MEKLNVKDSSKATILRGADMNEILRLKGKYTAKCFDKDGNLKWKDTIDNVVTDMVNLV